LTCLTLGLIDSPQVNDDSRQQIIGSGIGRRKFFRAPKLGKAFRKSPLSKESYKAESCARLGQRGRNRDGFLRITQRFWIRGRPLASEISHERPCFGTLCISQCITRVELDRLIVVTDGLAKIFDVTAQKMEATLKISIMCFCVVRRDLARVLGTKQRHFE
jgi:hypothetical protein